MMKNPNNPKKKYIVFDHKLIRYGSCKTEPLPSDFPMNKMDLAGNIAICGKAFEKIYCLSETKMKMLHEEIKSGKLSVEEYNDRNRADAALVEELKNEACWILKKDGEIGYVLINEPSSFLT
jgi:hypothetical protein